MNRFWNQTLEFKALVISIVATALAFGGTAFLFWFQRYDIPLAVLLGGIIVIISWLILFINKRKDKPSVKLDILAIYLRLTLVVILAIIFTVLDIAFSIVVISPIFLVVSYIGYSLLNLLAYIRRDVDVR